ncbi:cobamide remodeling phosphodiesterase CbiR [Desulfonauticus submarinus]
MMKTFLLSAPSYVLPATIEKNCLFLQKYVSGIYLAFFETKACLEYTEKDLPLSLANFPFRYHIHFPLDLKWQKDGCYEAEICFSLWEKVKFLSPWSGVLHPPKEKEKLQKFVDTWVDLGGIAEDLLIENIKGIDLVDLWPVVLGTGVNVCLDIGHMLAYGQESILHLSGFWERVKLLHFYGKETCERHYDLSFLSDAGWNFFKKILNNISDQTEIVLELFNKKDFLNSLRILRKKQKDLGVKFV